MKNRILLLTSVLFFVFSSPVHAQTWADVSPGWAGSNRTAYSMGVYGAHLHVGTHNTEGSQVWQYNGTAWTNIFPPWAAANIIAASMAVYGPNLYVGTNNSGGAQETPTGRNTLREIFLLAPFFNLPAGSIAFTSFLEEVSNDGLIIRLPGFLSTYFRLILGKGYADFGNGFRRGSCLEFTTVPSES